jgi:dsDNA-specific endonuclease/ATPase MutS2
MIGDEYSNDGRHEDVVEMPVDGILDLHTFAPRDVKDLVPTYLDACLERGIIEVQIIHGKGKGVLRRIVRAALDRHPCVVSYKYGSSWGVTIVTLEKRQH